MIKTSYRSSRYGYVIIGYAVIFLFFLVFSQSSYTFASRITGGIVFLVGTYPAISYLIKKKNHIPLIEIAMIAYVVAFSLPLFFQSEQAIHVKMLLPQSEPVTITLLLVIAALLSLWFGFQLAPRFFSLLSFPQLKFNCNPSRLFYYSVFLCVLSISLAGVNFGVFQGVLEVVANSELGVAILSLLFYKGFLSPVGKCVAISLLAIQILYGITTGMAEAMLLPALIWYMARWIVIRKLEITVILLGVVLLVLLQPVKLQYRQVVWFGTSQISSVEKLNTFFELFYDYWFVSEHKNKVAESTYSRGSLLLTTAHIIDWTPDVVEFKRGSTLSYMFITLIPRFIWPEKPIAQRANIDYALEYGVATIEGIKRTMFGAGHLGEIFMNFGAFGVLPSYLVIGFLYYLPLHLLSIPKNIMIRFQTPGTSEYVASIALLVAIMGKLIFIGSTVGDTMGGFIQFILVQGSMLYLIAGKKQTPVLH